MYRCGILECHSHFGLAWELSNTLNASFCVRAVQRAIARYGPLEVFNTDQGCQFTSAEFTAPLLALGLKLLMDGKGRCLDNVFVERLWRTVKYEEFHLKCSVSMVDAHSQWDRFFCFRNERRSHSSLVDATPRETYRATIPLAVNQ